MKSTHTNMKSIVKLLIEAESKSKPLTPAQQLAVDAVRQFARECRSDIHKMGGQDVKNWATEWVKKNGQVNS